jgi:hypothetical protein
LRHGLGKKFPPPLRGEDDGKGRGFGGEEGAGEAVASNDKQKILEAIFGQS